MGQYDQERERLTGVLRPLFKADLLGKSFPNTPDTDRMVDLRIAEEIDKFELQIVQRLHINARRPEFWFGVRQSLLATVIFTAGLYFAAFLLAATKIDAFKPIRPPAEQSTPGPTVPPKVPPSAAPTPTPAPP